MCLFPCAGACTCVGRIRHHIRVHSQVHVCVNECACEYVQVCSVWVCVPVPVPVCVGVHCVGECACVCPGPPALTLPRGCPAILARAPPHRP